VLLDKHEAAELLGIKPETLIHHASQTRNKPEAARDIHDCPLPVVNDVRLSDKPMGPRRIPDPKWDRDQLLAYKAAGRRKPAPRPRDGLGKYLQVPG
jgi:hypothetical protein